MWRTAPAVTETLMAGTIACQQKNVPFGGLSERPRAMHAQPVRDGTRVWPPVRAETVALPPLAHEIGSQDGGVASLLILLLGLGAHPKPIAAQLLFSQVSLRLR